MDNHAAHDMSGISEHDMNSMGHDMSSMGHDMSGHGMSGNEMPAMCAMNMLFNWQVKDVCVVFEWWHIHTITDLLISCVAVFCIAAGYEYLRVKSKTFDEHWSQNEKKKISEQRSLVGHGEEEIESNENGFSRKEIIVIRSSRKHEIIRSVIYATLVAISFWLMLVFMTYNGFLMIATVLGAGFGHLIFGHGKLKASRDIQCH